VWLNILYLLPVSVLPFGAALMARYDREPTALKMYGFLLLLIALTRLIVWLYVSSRPHLLYEPLSGRLKTVGVLIGAVPAAIYLLAILIADGAPLASLLIYCAVPVLYFIALFVDRSTAPRGRRRRLSPDPHNCSRVARIASPLSEPPPPGSKRGSVSTGRNMWNALVRRGSCLARDRADRGREDRRAPRG
jgi:hypothetical protein